jgi:hypothetical protein
MTEAYMLAQTINEFYQQAFGNALIVVGIVFGVVGVIVPVVMAYLQARHAASDLQQLKSQISAEVAAAVKEAIGVEREGMKEEQATALAAFQLRSDKVISDHKEEMLRQISAIRGGAFHVQAVTLFTADHHASAVKSACDAVAAFVHGQDYSTLRGVCTSYAIAIFEKVDPKGLGSMKDELIESCAQAISAMEGVNDRGEFTDLIRDLRHGLSEFKKRCE